MASTLRILIFASIVAACAERRAVESSDASRPSIDAGMVERARDATADAMTSDAGESPRARAEREAVEDNWALRVTRAIEAWALVRARGREPGQGVLIAHPDTGTSMHPELLAHPLGSSPIHWDAAYDFVDRDETPLHDFDALNRVPAHGHGTETSSVIVSPLGCPAPDSPRPCVTGVAPAARLAPLRVSDAVVLLSGDRIADAIEHAIERGAHVVSISMGGVSEMARLRTAIERALAAGIIVVAAAGNWTGIVVVRPASFDGVVCVAGITPDLRPWATSARGPRVDISGPATDVRYARTRREDGRLVYDVGLAEGTSDATAITAGAAALWLSYHGRDALIARYGAAAVPRLFRRLLREVAFQTPTDWPADGSYGPGVLDIVKLLEAPLP